MLDETFSWSSTGTLALSAEHKMRIVEIVALEAAGTAVAEFEVVVAGFEASDLALVG